MLRFGLVSEIYPDKGMCRVKFDDDEVVSKPLQIVFQGAKDNKYYVPFAINEQVAVLMAEDSTDGVVLGCLYNSEDQPSGTNDHAARIVFKDGTIIEYDFSGHKLTADVKGDIDVKATGNILADATGSVTAKAGTTADVEAGASASIKAPSITLEGDVSILGSVSMSGSGGGSTSVNITGTVNSTGDIVAGTKSLMLHTHGGVQTGGGTTGPPLG